MTSLPLRGTPVMNAAPERMTANELLTYDAKDHRTELVRGRLVVRDFTGGPHAGLLADLTAIVVSHVRSLQPSPGRVLVGDPGFWIARDPDTVRAPDLAFISYDRLPGGAVPPGLLEGAPNLAVEIRSPSDRTGAVLEKIGQWLNAGVTIVWVIDPQRRTAQQFAADGTITLLGEQDTLYGAPVLEGLCVPLPAVWGDAPRG